MKAKLFILSLMLLTSMTLLARQRDTVIVGDGYHYAGKWPEGKGVLYGIHAPGCPYMYRKSSAAIGCRFATILTDSMPVRFRA